MFTVSAPAAIIARILPPVLTEATSSTGPPPGCR